jgi:hypothetical protein
MLWMLDTASAKFTVSNCVFPYGVDIIQCLCSLMMFPWASLYSFSLEIALNCLRRLDHMVRFRLIPLGVLSYSVDDLLVRLFLRGDEFHLFHFLLCRVCVRHLGKVDYFFVSSASVFGVHL